MKTINLSAVTQGIQRLREKGSADPGSLYDLENGFVAIDGSTQQRPGTELAYDLPAGTIGYCVHDGDHVVFSTSPKACPSGVRCEVLTHPFFPSQGLVYIWFARPFLGYLYVSAEFQNGDVYHYWLQSANKWQASTMYLDGQIIVPTTANGLGYKAHRVLPKLPEWIPGMEVVLGTKIEPTVANGYYYEATATSEAAGVGTPGGSPNPTPPGTPGDGGPNAPTGWTAESGTWFEDPAGTYTIRPDGVTPASMYYNTLYAFGSGTFDASVDVTGNTMAAFIYVEFLEASGAAVYSEYGDASIGGGTSDLSVLHSVPHGGGPITHARVYLQTASGAPVTSPVVFSNLAVLVTP